MKFLTLFAILLILLTSCVKEKPLTVVSTDFKGKFVINGSANMKDMIYILDQNGLTQVPVLDTLSPWIYFEDCEWIRDGLFIFNQLVESSWLFESKTPLVIYPDGALVRDFNNDLPLVSDLAISPGGNRLAAYNIYAFDYPDHVYIYSLDQTFYPTLIDSVLSSWRVKPIVWAPDGERFLFEMPGDTLDFTLAVYDMTTRTTISIFEYAGLALSIKSPGWSADGSRVSFILDSILYIGDAEGLSIYPVSTESQQVQEAVWSTTTDEVAYLRWSPDKNSTEIVIYDPRSETRTLLPGSRFSNYIWNSIYGFQWAKDGSNIAYIGHHGLYVICRDGTHNRQVYDGSIRDFDWYED